MNHELVAHCSNHYMLEVVFSETNKITYSFDDNSLQIIFGQITYFFFIIFNVGTPKERLFTILLVHNVT